MTNELVALANGRVMGSVIYRNARLSFIYEESWRQDSNSYPLSLSMPLASAEHGHSRIERFLWGLLPDNDRVLENWAKRFQVSPSNAFRLIANVGEDCAGAVQFVRPDRVEALRTEPAAREIAWLTEDDIAERLHALRDDHSAWRAAADTASSVSQGLNQKPRFCCSVAAGVFLPAVRRQLISLNLRPASGTAMRRTSISACCWPGPPVLWCQIPEFAAFAMKSQL